MTEEDTFNRLRRHPLLDTIYKYNAWFDGYCDVWSEVAADEFLEEFGWTFAELGTAYIEDMAIPSKQFQKSQVQ